MYIQFAAIFFFPHPDYIMIKSWAIFVFPMLFSILNFVFYDKLLVAKRKPEKKIKQVLMFLCVCIAAILAYFIVYLALEVVYISPYFRGFFGLYSPFYTYFGLMVELIILMLLFKGSMTKKLILFIITTNVRYLISFPALFNTVYYFGISKEEAGLVHGMSMYVPHWLLEGKYLYLDRILQGLCLLAGFLLLQILIRPLRRLMSDEKKRTFQYALGVTVLTSALIRLSQEAYDRLLYTIPNFIGLANQTHDYYDLDKYSNIPVSFKIYYPLYNFDNTIWRRIIYTVIPVALAILSVYVISFITKKTARSDI